MKELRYAMLGTGALGGTYGVYLAHADRRISFMLRSDLEHVRTHGLFLKHPAGGIYLPEVECFSSGGPLPQVDVACIALKSTANEVLKRILPRLLGKKGVVLNLQNGLGLEEKLVDLLGAGRVLGGLCFICANKTGPGKIHHQDYGAVRMGAWNPEAHSCHGGPSLEEIADDFSLAGLDVSRIDKLEEARWQKLVWNIPFNGLCALHGLNTRELLENPVLSARVRRLMEETQTAARAKGFGIEDSFVEAMLENTRKMIAYSPSMKLDAEAGRALETESIHAVAVQCAREAGSPMLETERLLRQLREQFG